MTGISVPFWSPAIGDRNLTAALLQQILGSASGGAISNTAIATAGNGTLTAAGLAGGVITRTGPTGAYTDTTDTAAAIVTALGGFVSGMTFLTRIKNGVAFVQTIAAGTGVTISGTAVVAPFSVSTYFGVVGGTAAAPTVTLSHIATTQINASTQQANESATALNTVGAATIPGASFNSGILTRGGTQTAAFTDTTDTAANIIAGINILASDNRSVEWTYVNNGVFPATLAGGTGVTITGQTVIPANSWAKYLVTRNSATTMTLLCIGQGYFPKSGTVVANGATPVAVSDTAVTANSIITLTLKTAGGTPHGAFVSAATAGSGFSINSLAGDSSTYVYEIRG